jgi:hypothetical protein
MSEFPVTVWKYLSVFPEAKAFGLWYPSLAWHLACRAVRYAESGDREWAKCHTDRAILRALVAVAARTAVIPRISSGTPCAHALHMEAPMRRSMLVAIGVLAVGLSAFARSATAQTEMLPDQTWSHGTTLGLSGGVARASSDTSGMLGTALGWEINHRVEIEGTGAWLAGHHDDRAFAAELKVLASLTRPNTVVPFVGAGVGMYRASFDAASGALPDFYQRRFVGSALNTQHTFTDPSFVFATGLDIFTGRHLSIRPDVSVRLVTRSPNAYAVTMAALRVTYHFEVHDTK